MSISNTIRPSAATVKAAKIAAASPHGLVNLVRLVQALDQTSQYLEDEDEEQEQDSSRIRKDVDTARYARLILENLKNANEGPSTSLTLEKLDRTMSDVEKRYSSLETESLSKEIIDKPREPLASRAKSSASFELLAETSPTEEKSEPRPTLSPKLSTTLRSRKRGIDTAAYLRKRAEEDAAGAEVGLLPLRVVPQNVEKSSRDQLLGGGMRSGMGSRQLHEELGGQLADMSNRLKLNAIHFASSLNDEKDLLESSQTTLENNLVATRSSKQDLAKVSKKGRGTTCMTLGIVILVLIIFVWTYMLIRFT
ncbi:hypothetical protein BD324DRAFT_631085 [Kockovaella imperatae]|uniref:Uncharacterized protein n=1 Tax=Kockovaella imperatae TaxID=4999 RepID=A0A1Y1UDS4_9TREE|nr:hypothetical protein BD324DRAFT_631085 [Kockovaella imperatae]ORX35666.1 hypothetical protein BD324DRAFT_631085 [Kockovaella imperatae]